MGYSRVERGGRLHAWRPAARLEQRTSSSTKQILRERISLRHHWIDLMAKVDAIDVRKLRRSLQMSQPEFAQRFGVNLGTLRQWEQGRRLPEGPALVLLSVIARSPDAVRDAVEAAA